MAIGLLMGLFTLGMRGAGNAINFYKDYQKSKDVRYMERWGKYYYYDSRHRTYDAETGHRINEVNCYKINNEWLPPLSSKGVYYGVKHGDMVLWDEDTKKVLVNVTARRNKQYRERIIKEWRAKGHDEEFIFNYVDKYYPER